MSYITEELEKILVAEQRKLDATEAQLRRKRVEIARVEDEMEILRISIKDQIAYIRTVEKILHHEEDKEINSGLKNITQKR